MSLFKATIFASVFVSAAITAHAAEAPLLQRAISETPLDFAKRALKLSSDQEPTALDTAWNRRPTIFVTYLQGDERELVALQKIAGNSYREFPVTTGEEEGGTPNYNAIGFDHPGGASTDWLIVILSWPQQHAAVEGTLYEVRIFQDAVPPSSKITYLKSVSAHFDKDACDCSWDDGKTAHYHFKTIAAVKTGLAELRGRGQR